MILISDKNELKTYYFPKNITDIEADVEDFTLTVINRTDNTKNVYIVKDEDSINNFYSFSILFEDLMDGEYEYIINDINNKIVGKGMILVENTEDVKYYDQNIIYNVYDGTE